MSSVTSDRVWFSNHISHLILTNKTGTTIYRVPGFCRNLHGLHTVSSENELFYIDENYNINKVSKDMKTLTTFIEVTDLAQEPRCVYCSPSSGDLLIGMYNYHTMTGNVTRYNQSGQVTQIIQHDNIGFELYNDPHYIIENNNGDVVVSDYDNDFGAVVVTEQRTGIHRFSYRGPLSGSGLKPRGICTDSLSHILVCNELTNTVQIIDKDGHFLSHLLIRPSGLFSPRSLSYDVNTHRLWAGSSDNNTVVIYRYITRHNALTDVHQATAGVMESHSVIPNTGLEKPYQGNQCLLKLLSPPELLYCFTVKGIDGCYHISCVTSDLVWVSGDDNKLILANTTGAPHHRVADVCSDDDLFGLHTVNSENELIYIDDDYNIKKLSTDMNTTTTFIEATSPTWRAGCVYWSPFSRDLLVGMNNYREGKVTRYNQNGELTQTISHDNTGLQLYNALTDVKENNNGDTVVSDEEALVVTERGRRYRFSYTGHHIGLGLLPRGICTDALSHILVCDDKTKTVQIIDSDGKFLSLLLTKSQLICKPHSLSYDFNTHSLLVGSHSSKEYVYRYIEKEDALTTKNRLGTDRDVMSSRRTEIA